MVTFFIVKPRVFLLEAVETDRRLQLGSKVLHFVCITGIHTYICIHIHAFIYIYMQSLCCCYLWVTPIFQLLIIKLVTGDILAVLPVLIMSYILLVCY